MFQSSEATHSQVTDMCCYEKDTFKSCIEVGDVRSDLTLFTDGKRQLSQLGKTAGACHQSNVRNISD